MRSCLALLAILVSVPSGALGTDLRSTELVRLECASDIGRVETVLFANGTVRRRTAGEEGIALGELTAEEVDVYVERLRAHDMGRIETQYRRGVSGDWVDLCELMLDLDGSGSTLPTYFRFGPYDAHPSPLGSVLDIVRELDGHVAVASAERLPPDYEGRPGDILRTASGSEFRIVGSTGDGRGFELVQLDQPLTIFVLREDMVGRFAAIVSRRGER